MVPEQVARELAYTGRILTAEEALALGAVREITTDPVGRGVALGLEMARHGHIWGDLKRRSASAERRSQYQCDHHEIVAALKARDAAAAVSAMRAHLARVSDHLNATDPAAGIWP